jgi:hypothetical protein
MLTLSACGFHHSFGCPMPPSTPSEPRGDDQASGSREVPAPAGRSRALGDASVVQARQLRQPPRDLFFVAEVPPPHPSDGHDVERQAGGKHVRMPHGSNQTCKGPESGLAMVSTTSNIGAASRALIRKSHDFVLEGRWCGLRGDFGQARLG